MRLILLGYYAAFFPVKFPRITPAKHHTNSRRHHPGQWCHYGENGAGHRLFFTHAHKCAPGVTLDGMASQSYNVNTGVKRPKSRIATNAAYFLYIKIGVM